MELLDRDYQRELLTKLSNAYPTPVSTSRFFLGDDPRRRDYNLAYLEEHRLVECKWSQSMAGPKTSVVSTISAQGIDFIAADGGLSAILGVVTVKLHDDTIRQLLINRIERAGGDSTIKGQLIAKVKALPAEALGKLMTDGFDAALARAPDLLDFLSGLLR